MFRKFAGSLKRSTVVAIASVVVGTLFVGIPVVLPASAAAPVGLVGRWSFESNMTDTSGNNLAAGQLFGAATYGAGKNGSGLVLNGSTNTFAQIPNSATLKHADDSVDGVGLGEAGCCAELEFDGVTPVWFGW
jgi:hypothetical protein